MQPVPRSLVIGLASWVLGGTAAAQNGPAAPTRSNNAAAPTPAASTATVKQSGPTANKKAATTAPPASAVSPASPASRASAASAASRAAHEHPRSAVPIAAVDGNSQSRDTDESIDQSSALPNRCTSSELESYARRRAFTLHLMDQRARQRFEAEFLAYEQRREFTERLAKQRQLAESDRKQFDQQVVRYARLHEFTSRLMDERDLRDALAYARELQLHEQKRAFTQRLLQSRQVQPPTTNNSTAAAETPEVQSATSAAKTSAR